MQNLLLIGCGGFLGSVCRAVLSGAVAKFCPDFPLATLCVNALGSFLIGVLLSLNLSENLRLFLVVGTLGGFTTFSTLSLECWTLWQAQQFGWLALYVAASLVLGLAAVAGGFVLGRILFF